MEFNFADIPDEPNGIINEKYKFIYFFINTVANTSFKIWCHNLNGVTYTDIHSKHVFVDKTKLNDYKDYFKFAIIRNPYDRFLSFYLHKVQRRLEDPKQKQALKVYYGNLFNINMSMLECAKLVSEISDKKQMFTSDHNTRSSQII